MRTPSQPRNTCRYGVLANANIYMDSTDLRVMMDTGTKREKYFAYIFSPMGGVL